MALSFARDANAQQTGWWWNPDESGRGFFIEQQGDILFLAGYLYADDGSATWFIASGPMTSPTLFSGDILTFSGGQTLDGSYTEPEIEDSLGAITVEFQNDDHAEITWVGGVVPITRFDFQGIGGPTPPKYPQSGWWWNPDENGSGFTLEIQNGFLFMVGFMYDGTGKAVWYFTSGPMTNNVYEGPLGQFAGGQTITGPYVEPELFNENVGTVRMEFKTPFMGVMTLPDGRETPIERFKFYQSAACNQLDPDTNVIGDEEIVIGNDKIAIHLDAHSGTINTIANSEHGVELSLDGDGDAYKALWGLHRKTGAKAEIFTDNRTTNSFNAYLTNINNSFTATLKWKGINFHGNTDHLPNAVVIATVEVDCTESLSRWDLSFFGLENSSLYEIDYPVIGTSPLGPVSADDKLLMPYFEGRLFSDPIGQKLGWGGHYPYEPQNMQFIAFYDQDGGFYIGVEDGQVNTKMIAIFPNGEQKPNSVIRVDHLIPDELYDSVDLGYEVVIRGFQGDWMTAADFYKEFAHQQSWVTDSGDKKIPEWLNDAGLSRTYNMHWDSDYQVFLNHQQENTTHFESPVVTVLWGWENGGIWAYGDYYPPKAGWELFDEAIGKVKSDGTRVDMLISMIYTSEGAPTWQSGDLTDEVARTMDGSLITSGCCEGDDSINQTFIAVSPSSEIWQKMIIDNVIELAQHNVDMVQLDNWPIGDPVDDYSVGHTPGFGGHWQSDAYIETLFNMRERLDDEGFPDFAISSEGFSEQIIPFVDSYLSRDLFGEALNFRGEYNLQGSEMVPLISYVYRPYIHTKTEYWPQANNDSPISYHMWAYSRGFLAGQMLAIADTPWLSDSRFSKDVLQFFNLAVKIRLNFKGFLVQGEMHRMPAFESPVIDVELDLDQSGVENYKGTAPAVDGALWQNSDGRLGLFLTNISDSQKTVTLDLNISSLPLVDKPEYVVNTVDESGNIESSEVLKTELEKSVSVDAYSIVILTIE